MKFHFTYQNVPLKVVIRKKKLIVLAYKQVFIISLVEIYPKQTNIKIKYIGKNKYALKNFSLQN